MPNYCHRCRTAVSADVRGDDELECVSCRGSCVEVAVTEGERHDLNAFVSSVDTTSPSPLLGLIFGHLANGLATLTEGTRREPSLENGDYASGGEMSRILDHLLSAADHGGEPTDSRTIEHLEKFSFTSSLEIKEECPICQENFETGSVFRPTILSVIYCRLN